MKLSKDVDQSNYMNADDFRQGDMIDVDISLAAGNIEIKEAKYDDGSVGKRLNLPVIMDGHIKQMSVGKTVKNDLIDVFGDETDTWDGGHIQFMVVDYPQLGHKGFVVRKQGCMKPTSDNVSGNGAHLEAPPTPPIMPASKTDAGPMTEKWKEFLAENMTAPTNEAGIIKLVISKIPDASTRKLYSETRKTALAALATEGFLVNDKGNYSVA